MLPKTNQPTQNGFTLIEILVTLLMFGIISAIAAPSFMTWVNNKKIEDVAMSIEGALKEAQSTAIRKNKTCSVVVTSTTVSTPDAGCLPSGTRQIQEREVMWSNRNLTIAGTGGASGTTATFTSIGTTIVSPSTTTFVIYRTDGASNGRRKCVVVSSGIGIIKNGRFTGSLPLSLSSPPTTTEVTAVADACSIS